MNNLFKALTIAAGAIFTIGVIVLAFTFFNKGKDMATSAQKQILNMEDVISDSDKEMYDNTDLTGADVLTALNQFKNDKVCIKVVIGSTTTDYFYTETGVVGVTDLNVPRKETDTGKYIDRNAEFTSTLLYNATTKELVGIKFTKK
jgi:hypothetical protein